MAIERYSTPRDLEKRREQVLALLKSAFADGEIGLDEFDWRMGEATQADSVDRLAALAGGLALKPEAMIEIVREQRAAQPAAIVRGAPKRIGWDVQILYAVLAFGLYSCAHCAFYVWRH